MAAKGKQAKKGTQRKLTAILSADVVGYSRLMGADEEFTIETLTAYRKVFTSEIKNHNGRALPLLLICIACLAALVCSQAEKGTAQTLKAQQGDAQAQYNRGLMYARGRGVPRDYGEAVKWFRKAAQQGFAEAQISLGAMYATGGGVTQDDGEAAKWFRKAAQQGYAQGQYILGVLYQQGRGVARDVGEAVRWYLKAAAQGHGPAWYILAVMYDEGRDVPRDYVAAYKWYDLAAKRSTGKWRSAAVINLKKLVTLMTPGQIAEAQRAARQWTREHP